MTDQYDPQTGEVSQERAITVAYQAPLPVMNDPQVALALARPRPTFKAIQAKIVELATMDEESAAECLYALVRGSKKKNKQGNSDDTEAKPIEGPSIRLAEIAAQQYGNCRIDAHVVEVNKQEKWVEAEGIFIDLETNMGSRSRVRRRISTSGGYLFSEDMILVTSNAACAIAKRNAILAGIPRPLYRVAYQAARKMIAGDAESLPKRRGDAFKAFAAYGVKPEQIIEHLNLETSDDITGDHLVTLIGIYQAIKSGESTVEEAFAKEAEQRREVDKTYNPLDRAGQQGKPAQDKASQENNPATEGAQQQDQQPQQGKPAEGEDKRTAADVRPKPTKLTDDELETFFAEGKTAKAAGGEPSCPYEGQAREVWFNGWHSE
jgi:ribosome modulation factor